MFLQFFLGNSLPTVHRRLGARSALGYAWGWDYQATESAAPIVMTAWWRRDVPALNGE